MGGDEVTLELCPSRRCSIMIKTAHRHCGRLFKIAHFQTRPLRSETGQRPICCGNWNNLLGTNAYEDALLCITGCPPPGYPWNGGLSSTATAPHSYQYLKLAERICCGGSIEL